jgi:hypothetical protein
MLDDKLSAEHVEANFPMAAHSATGAAQGSLEHNFLESLQAETSD